MAASREKELLARVLAHEGGYSNHPKDPGGATMKGVTSGSMTACNGNGCQQAQW